MVRAATTQLSSKGQVVIPEEIRKRMGLETGAKFVVVGEGDVVALKVLSAPLMSAFTSLLKKARASAEEAELGGPPSVIWSYGRRHGLSWCIPRSFGVSGGLSPLA